ncbi:Inhibitor of apoptosis 2, partial [Caligus rogercresseyi]
RPPGDLRVLPLSYIEPVRLPAPGLSTAAGVTVCAVCFCGEYVGDWDQDDDPEEEHRNLFSHCPFVRGLDVGNIPISRRPFSSSPSATDFFNSSASLGSAAGFDEVGIRSNNPRVDPNRHYCGKRGSF